MKPIEFYDEVRKVIDEICDRYTRATEREYIFTQETLHLPLSLNPVTELALHIYDEGNYTFCFPGVEENYSLNDIPDSLKLSNLSLGCWSSGIKDDYSFRWSPKDGWTFFSDLHSLGEASSSSPSVAMTTVLETPKFELLEANLEFKSLTEQVITIGLGTREFIPIPCKEPGLYSVYDKGYSKYLVTNSSAQECIKAIPTFERSEHTPDTFWVYYRLTRETATQFSQDAVGRIFKSNIYYDFDRELFLDFQYPYCYQTDGTWLMTGRVCKDFGLVKLRPTLERAIECE